MEELIGRYFFIVIVIFATVLDLVGRWYKNRQRRGGQQRRSPRAEPREQVDWRKAKAAEPDWRQMPEAREGEAEPVVPRKRTPELPDFAQILLDELDPPDVLAEMRRVESGRELIEQPMIARVVPKARPAVRDAAVAARQVARTATPATASPARGLVRAHAPAGRRVMGTLRAALEDPGATRRAVVLAEVLGPCRGLEPYSLRR